MPKERVDVLAYKQGLFETREQAKRGVMAGLVVNVINGERYDKPGEKIDDGTELKLKGEKLRYVSRGGLKLEKALAVFNLSVEDMITIDIGASTGGFLPALAKILVDGGQVVALVKPQFEAGREQIGKNGIVRESSIHEKVLETVTAFAVDYGFSVKGLDFSPIQGGHGNIEFLAHLEKTDSPQNDVPTSIKEVVAQAHKEFKKNEEERSFGVNPKDCPRK